AGTFSVVLPNGLFSINLRRFHRLDVLPQRALDVRVANYRKSDDYYLRALFDRSRSVLRAESCNADGHAHTIDDSSQVELRIAGRVHGLLVASPVNVNRFDAHRLDLGRARRNIRRV